MRRSPRLPVRLPLLLALAAVGACGDKVEEQRPVGARIKADQAEGEEEEHAGPTGLGDGERDRLTEQFAREARDEIDLGNAEGEAWRMLQTLKAELAAERTAAGIGDAGPP